jgi:sugar lactone lactonase YvrE
MKFKLALITLLNWALVHSIVAQEISTLILDTGKNFESIHWHEDGRIFSADYNNGRLYQIFMDGSVETLLTGIANTAGGGFAPDGQFYYSALASGKIYQYSPDGTNTLIASGLNQPTGILYTTSPDTLLVGQYGNSSVVKVSISSGTITPFAMGNGINGPDAIIYHEGDRILVANFNNHKIHEVDDNGNVSEFATIPSAGYMGYIASIDGEVFAPSFSGKKIYKVTNDGNVVSIAGTGQAGSVDGSGSTASFSAPNGIASNPAGDTLLITDGNRVRIMTNFSTVTNIEEKLGISELQIGPNPVADQLYVRFELEEVDSLMWRVINKSGMLMAQSSFQQMSVGRQEIEVSLKNLANGIYHLQLLNEQGQKRSAAFIKAE